MQTLTGLDPAQRHRAASERFGEVAVAVRDWTSPAPVPGWVARDVVDHLVEWSGGFLAGGGFPLAPTAESEDPADRWRRHAAAVQALVEVPDARFVHPMVGEHPVGEAIDRFYTADVFMHTWDLARSAGVDHGLDPSYAEQLLAGMRPIEDLLRSSGQYGPAMPAPADADPVTALMAFVGRDVVGWDAGS